MDSDMAAEHAGDCKRRAKRIVKVCIGTDNNSIMKAKLPALSAGELDRGTDIKGFPLPLHFYGNRQFDACDAERGRLALNFEGNRLYRCATQEEAFCLSQCHTANARSVALVLKVHRQIGDSIGRLHGKCKAESTAIEVRWSDVSQIVMNKIGAIVHF